MAFHRNALQIAAISWLISLLEPNSSPAAQTKIWEDLSGEKALAHVQRLVDFGPRPSGSEAIENSRRYIEDQLRRSGWQVTRQAFTDDTPRGKVQFVNLIAQFSGQGNVGAFVFVVLALRHENIRRHKIRRSERWWLKHRTPFGISASNRAASELGCESRAGVF